MKIRKIILISLALFTIGFLFRLIILVFFPQSFVYDQVVYQYIAQEMMKRSFYVDRYRSYGFPFILSSFFRLISTNHFLWMLFQNVLDTLVGVMIFIMGKIIFKSTKIAFVSSFLYMMNVFTAVYVGLLLSEVTATFFVCLFFILLLVSATQKRTLLINMGLILILGFLPQIKPSFLFFDFLFLFVVSLWTIRRKGLLRSNMLSCLLILVLFVAPFIPMMIGNYLYWNEINITEVDNNFIKEFYISLFMENGVSVMSPQVYKIHNEYHTGLTASARKQTMMKYLDLSVSEIKQDPLKFIIWRIKKMWFIWDKPYVFLYNQSFVSNFVNKSFQVLNLIILFACLIGMGVSLKSMKKERSNLYVFHISWVLFVLYITISHSFSLADGRYTIPLYPIVFLYAGLGFYKVSSKILKSFIRSVRPISLRK